MTRYLFIYFSFFFFIRCNNEPQEIYSSLDGINYQEILNGPVNTEQYILSHLHGKDTSFKDEYFDQVVEKLEDNNHAWRINAFHLLSIHCGNLNNNQQQNLKSSLFNYFLHFPNEYMSQIEQINITNSDCFLELFSDYIHHYLITHNITLISMKNVAYKYCNDCNDEEIKSIYSYLELASRFQKE